MFHRLVQHSDHLLEVVADFKANFSFRITTVVQSMENQLNSDTFVLITSRDVRITIFHAHKDVHYSVDVLNLRHLHNVDDIGLPCRNLQHLTLT